MGSSDGAAILLGSILSGISEGRQQKIDREEKREQIKLQKELMKLQLENARSKAKQTDFKTKIFDTFLTPQSKTVIDAPTVDESNQPFNYVPPPDNIETQTSNPLMEMLLQGESDNGNMMNPLTAMMLKSATGMDFPGYNRGVLDQKKFKRGITTSDREYILRLEKELRAIKEFEKTYGLKEDEFNRGFNEWKPVQEVLPDNSTRMRMLPKYLGGGNRLSLNMPKTFAEQDYSVPTDYDVFAGEGQEMPMTSKWWDGIKTKLPKVETFEYEAEDGTKMSVIRNTQTGQRMTKPVPVSPPKPGSTDMAARVALAYEATKHVERLKNLLLKKDNNGNLNFDKKLALQSRMPFGGIGEGRTVKAVFMDALDARIRAATGAAVTKEEWASYFLMYLPSVLDSDALAENKLQRLENFIGTYLDVLDPKGVVRGRLNKRESAKNKKYEIDKVYTNAEGERAIYLGDGKWQMVE